MIFYFRLCQGGLAGGAPVNRFFAAKQAAIPGKLAALPGDGGLVYIVHGQVGIVPLPHHPETFEFLALNVDEFLGVGTAQPAQLGLGKRLFLIPDLLVHVVFDGKPVAVPARNVNGIVAGHLF